MALTSEITAKLTATLTSALDLVTVSVPQETTARTRLSSGTGADQADMVWSDTRTLNASADEDLDFAAGLTGALGTTLTFARIKAILITADSGNTNNVNVTAEGTNGVPIFLALGDGVAVRPGGTFLLVAPDATAYAVTADTGDLINVANSAGSTSVTYSITVIGASA